MKTRIAEGIISLVLPPDRAVSMVGDFAEQAERRGSLWFWSGIFRTTASIVRDDLLGHFGFWASLAIRAWILGLITGAGLFFGFVLLFMPLLILLTWPIGGISQAVGRDLGTVAGYAMPPAAIYWAGRWLGRRAPNREFAACIAAFLIPTLVVYVLGFVVMEIWGKEIERFVANQHVDQSSPSTAQFLLVNLLFVACLFAGAIRARYLSRRRIAR